MMNTSRLGIAIVIGSVVLAGCAAQPNYQTQNPSQQYPSQGYPTQGDRSQDVYVGTVDRIEVINRGDSSNAAGTVIGGIVGGLIGHQIGGGTGQTAATIVGAAGGAYAGNQIQQRQRAPYESFRITVRMDNGTYQTITADNITDLRVGDRIRVDGNNNIARY